MCRAKIVGGRRCPAHTASSRRTGRAAIRIYGSNNAITRAAVEALPVEYVQGTIAVRSEIARTTTDQELMKLLARDPKPAVVDALADNPQHPSVNVSYRNFKTTWSQRLTESEFLPEEVPNPETEHALLSIQRDPNSMVRIYRALPANKNQINSGGDFVGLSWETAESHRQNMAATYRKNQYHVISTLVPASDVLTRRDPEGNVHLTEFGYDGPKISAERYTGVAPGTPYTGGKVGVGDWVSLDSGGDGGGIFWARVAEIKNNLMTLPLGAFECQRPMERITHHEPSRLPHIPKTLRAL